MDSATAPGGKPEAVKVALLYARTATMVESTARRRANGEGYLKHDATRDRWRGAVAWTDSHGHCGGRAFSGRRQADVKRRMDALRAELAAGSGPASTRTVADYLTGWLEAERARVRPSTWLFREGHVRLYIVPAVGAVRLGALAPRDVERVTAAMVERGLAPRTAVGCRHDAPQGARRCPTRRARAPQRRGPGTPPRIPGRAVEYLTRDELRRLLEAAAGDPLGPLVILAATTGLRQGELLGLAWADVDTTGATLTVRQAMARDWSGGYSLAEPKTTRSRRTIHLPALAVDALNAQSEAQAAARTAAGADWQDVDGLVFTDAIGRPLKGDNVSHGFHDLLERAKLRSVPFHALRHSWATLALASGVPLKVVADNLGHAPSP